METENKEKQNFSSNEKKKNKNYHKEIEKLKQENTILNDKYLRINAEMQNMKRRYEEEISKIYKYDGEDFIKNILPIIDNFERAILMDDSDLTDELSKFLSGFKMIYANLLNTLKEKGIREIDCLGQNFDPDLMEAVLTESEKDKASGIVLDVMQKGYMYNDKVIRPAMVKVNE